MIRDMLKLFNKQINKQITLQTKQIIKICPDSQLK